MAPLKLSKLFDEQQIATRVKEMGQEITQLCKTEELITICVLKGSFMFYSDLIRQIEADVTCEFFGCSSYAGTKSTGEVKLTLDLTNSIEGKNVLLIEDIVDTGLTMSYLRKNLELRNPKSLKTCSFLFKPAALKTKCKLDYVGFEISNEFVVGYGLDYQGFYRNLPYIAQVNNIQ